MPTTAGTQSDDELRRLVRQKAGLTRVATIVAEGVPAAELFAALTQEVVHALEVPAASLVRYEADGSTVVLASLNAPDFPVGGRLPLDGDSLSTAVLETGRPARAESEVRSEVGVPIVVDGEVWGLIRAGATCPQPLPVDIEPSLRDFTELVATAISKTASRESLRRVVAEQAALRNVATLVAEGAAPAEVFSCVAKEVARILDVSAVSVVRFDSDTWSVVVASFSDPGFPVGSRWPLEGPSLNATVFRTGQPAQIDYSELPGPVAAATRSAGLRVGVGVPIVVEGRVWGMIAVGQRHRRDALPAFAGSYSGRIVLSTASPQETQTRLAAFTQLVATAISKAQAHDDLSGLAMEQAALRRVATLVARDASPGAVFDVVAMEVGTLLDTDITVVGRYDGDGAATAIGSWSASPGGVPVGTRSVLGGHNVLSLVAETERPARVDGYDDASGEAADIARHHGWSSSIAAPIIVEGRLWGVMLVATERPEPFPAGAEERLAAFTDLVATALANAQAHDEVLRFGEEQAALGRVATLVAAGAAPEQVFATVVDEASSLLGLERIEFVRYDGDNTGTVIAASGDHPFPTGSTWSLEDPSVMATVARTRRTARIDDYAALKGEIARTARSAGFQSAIGAPLTVEGHLWGVIIAISTDPEPIPERSEARLAQFTELVATAVANAEARQALERVADEQATLRRIATLVARGVQPEELFAAVAEETAATFDAITALMRFEHDPPGAALLGVSKEAGLPVGTRWEFAEGMSSAEVYRTGRSARLSSPRGADYWSSLSGPVAESGVRLGIVSQVSCPIVVEGGVWGVITVNGREDLPPDTEQRLEKFTDLVTTAIANADARNALAQLAEEQAALRRVATLVARGTEPATVFREVCNEAQALLGAERAGILRFHDDRTVTVMANSGGQGEHEVGVRISFDPGFVVDWVHETHQAARFDTDDPAAADMPEVVRVVGVRSAVGSPIVVDGELWGVITVASVNRSLPVGMERRLVDFTELVATAIANTESKSELTASRRRIVAAADDARRRIERDLHDGIQQRLIALSFRARAMTRRPPAELPGLAAELADGLKDTSEELREVSRGIHPTILTEAGLGPALRALARRSEIPVDVDVRLGERLPAPVEAAAYYIASEALTNVAKHAHANVVQLIATHDNGLLALEVRDDGVGGVDPDRGSGILGLTDRVEALGGTISITNPPGHGTAIAVELPIATPVMP
jgi:GAF domain-containing protein